MLSSKNIIPMTTVRRHFALFMNQIQGNHEPVLITKEGRAAAVLISPEEYDRLSQADDETNAILRDQSLMQSLARAKEDVKAGRLYTDEEVFGS